MKRLRVTLLSVLAWACLSAVAQAETTIVILRHGEKPAQGLGQLTCQGLNRSLALAPLLLGRFGPPAGVYATNPAIKKKDHGVEYAYVRPLATIEPTAIRAGLPVNLDWGMEDIEPLAAALLAAPEGVQLVAWEHHWGENLARRLLLLTGGDAALVPRWADQDYDSLYVVRVTTDANGQRHGSFRHEQQNLDHLSTSCDSIPNLSPTSN